MHLNEFAANSEPLDMTQFAEFESLLLSAADLGIPHARDTRYVSRNALLNHLRLHFLEWGDPAAPAIVLLHGGNQSAHSWDLVSLHLADRYHVYALDQRGHGDSEWARDADYSPAAMARDALAFFREEGMAAPIVIGHSMGGMVTMTLTAQSPDVPRAIVLVDAAPTVSLKGVEQIRSFITHNVEFDSIDEFVDRVAGYDPFRSREHMERTARYNLIERADGKFISKSDRILHDPQFRRLREGARESLLETVDSMRCPTLIVRGERSRVLEPQVAEAFARQLPQGALVTVADCGHNVHSQNTPGFLDALRPFLESLDS